MAQEQFFVQQFDDSLTLLAQQLDYVVSAAIVLAVRPGAAGTRPNLPGPPAS